MRKGRFQRADILKIGIEIRWSLVYTFQKDSVNHISGWELTGDI